MKDIFGTVLLMIFCFFVYPIMTCVAIWIVDYINKQQKSRRNDKDMD